MEESERNEELRWRLGLLLEKLNDDKIHIAPHIAVDFQKSLGAVKVGSDGKIDLATVNSHARALAFAVAYSERREEVKNSISLQDIANTYFEFVEANFGNLAKDVQQKGYNAHEAAQAISEAPEMVEELSTNLPNFLEPLAEFWADITEPASYHVQDLCGLKAVYGGDLFPSYTNNIASSVGLYMNTIILPDPFWHTRPLFEHAPKDQQAYYLIKHALNVLQYKELATANTANPIVVFVPFLSSIDEQEQKLLTDIAGVDALQHATILFGRNFENLTDLRAFCSDLDTADKVVAALAAPDRLLFDTEWKGTLEEQIIRSMDSRYSGVLGISHPGQIVFSMCFGRMGQATDLLFKSRYLMGVPLIEAQTSWQYFNWKLEYNAARPTEDTTSLHMIRGLQHASKTDEEWLGNIPPAALIEMRQQGAFEEIRAILSNGVNEIALANPDGFFRTSDKVVDNIRNAFEAHKKEVANLRARGVKFAGHDLGLMAIAGGIDIASCIAGSPSFGLASFALNQLVDVPKMREIPARFRDLKNAHKELKKSPMGIFFKHK